MIKIKLLKKGFTLAETLITLSVIGIVAAITIPALVANINEKVFVVQKKALHARMAQAIAQFDRLGGYGKVIREAAPAVGNEGDANYVPAVTKEETYAESFVIALSKFLKMNSICSSDNLTACGIPTEVLSMSAIPTTVTLISEGTPKTLGELNNMIANPSSYPGDLVLSYTDAKPAAFTTASGESVLVYYNPTCKTDNMSNQFISDALCANFVYDLNGSKGPNLVGKDIGFMIAYSDRNSELAAPIPSGINFLDKYTYDEALSACREIDEEMRLPDAGELLAMVVNKFLLGTVQDKDFNVGESYWSGSITSAGKDGYAWSANFENGARWQDKRTDKKFVMCVRR